jgi:hypothetical protein
MRTGWNLLSRSRWVARAMTLMLPSVRPSSCSMRATESGSREAVNANGPYRAAVFSMAVRIQSKSLLVSRMEK